MTPPMQAYSLPDNISVAQKSLQLVLEAAATAISTRGRFVLALAGGNTPQQLYTLLRDANVDWQHWHLVYGDERYLPSGHPDRNSTLVEHSWLNHCTFPAANHHPLPEHLPLAEATHQYGQTIEQLLPIDVALLGIGEDGHTASLFPQNMANDMTCTNLCIPVRNAPKPPAERISLSYAALNKARVVCFLATGSNKKAILQQWQKNPDLPCNRIHGTRSTMLLTDQDL